MLCFCSYGYVQVAGDRDINSCRFRTFAVTYGSNCQPRGDLYIEEVDPMDGDEITRDLIHADDKTYFSDGDSTMVMFKINGAKEKIDIDDDYDASFTCDLK